MIELSSVRAGYNGTEVLKGISFKLGDGDNLSIIGPNGCGKTTLLRVISGTLPFSGDVSIKGTDISSMKRKELAKRVAMLSQMTPLNFNYTVMETVMMGRFVHESGSLFSGESAADRSAVMAALETLDLLALKDREVDTLSGGQLQRVFLAKIMAQDPEIILLDEPTNHLDLSYQIELIRFFKTWSKRGGKMVIGVLHDINLAMLLTDNVILMEDGCIKAFGKNKEVYSSDVLASTYKMDVVGYMLESLGKWEEIIK